MVVVDDRHELGPHSGGGLLQQGVPNVGRAVVFRAAQHAYVHPLTTMCKGPLPVNAGVGCQHQVGLVLIGQVVQEMSRRGRLPEKLVHLPWASMDEKHALGAPFESERGRQLTHPLAVGGIGRSQRVIVADLGEVVVARIGVATLAIVQAVADGVVVVALNTRNPFGSKNLQAPIGVRAKTAEVSQAVNRFDSARPGIEDRSRQCQMVAVDAAEAGNG